MRKILILTFAVALVLVGGAFATAQAQTSSNTCYYQGCKLDFNLSPCSWSYCDLLPWNWNWSALSPCSWRSACGISFISNPNPARAHQVAQATSNSPEQARVSSSP